MWVGPIALLIMVSGNGVLIINHGNDEIARGRITLKSLLPRESASKEVDAALLSIISYPAFAVEDPGLCDRTFQKIINELAGNYVYKRFSYETQRPHGSLSSIHSIINKECQKPVHIHTLEEWQHSHDFSGNQHQAEKSTKIVMVLTALTMIAEIAAGTIFGSMALLADGWHMATHVAAFGITVFAYQYARNNANNPKYTFGTGKVSVLAGFTSAVVLGIIALFMGIESLQRFFTPTGIQFNESITIAIIGLFVNIVSAFLLQDHHDHEHHHEHQQDHNLRAAYFHVLADALTSVFAIIALFAGKFLGWVWMDAAMGLVGAGVISQWSYGLLQDTGLILLDGSGDKQIRLAIVNAIEENSDNRVTDIHIWYVGQHHLAAMISLVTHDPKTPEYYKMLLRDIPTISHVSIEVNPCHGESCQETRTC